MKIAVNKNIVNFKPYNEISKSQNYLFENKNVLKLDWNESVRDLPKHIKSKFIEQLKHINLNFYPDLEARSFKKKLVEYTDKLFENLEVFNGLDSSLDYICRTFLNIDDKVAIIDPTYGNFKTIAQQYVSEIHSIVYPNPFFPDIKFLKTKLEDLKPKLVYLVNPNNPTGTYINSRELEKIIIKLDKTLFIIDEAYFEFIGKTSINLIDRNENVVISRTFSKAFGLAGIRLGYIISNSKIIKILSSVKNNKEVSTIAQILGVLALENPKYMYDYISEVKISKKKLKSYFDNIGVICSALEGNFLMIKVSNPKKFLELLENSNIFIRDRSYLPGLDNYVRITIGDIQTTNNLIQKLDKLPISKYIFKTVD